MSSRGTSFACSVWGAAACIGYRDEERDGELELPPHERHRDSR
jgi:hypothetical protein